VAQPTITLLNMLKCLSSAQLEQYGAAGLLSVRRREASPMRPSSPQLTAAAHAAGDSAAAARHPGAAVYLPLQQLQHDGEQRGPTSVLLISRQWSVLVCCARITTFSVMPDYCLADAGGELPARRGSMSQLVRRGSRKASLAAGALLKQLQVNLTAQTRNVQAQRGDRPAETGLQCKPDDAEILLAYCPAGCHCRRRQHGGPRPVPGQPAADGGAGRHPPGAVRRVPAGKLFINLTDSSPLA
jgi:hypothetical protein